MYLATIDCGTTNSRVYIVDDKGKVLAKAAKKVGVRDTAIHGGNQVLKEGLKETLDQALETAGLDQGQIRFLISSGMITSEIGLKEIPHLSAPAGLDDLARSMERVLDPAVFPADIPIYFVRGIKNRFDPDTAGVAQVGELDFMRGEETQVAGVLSGHDLNPPLTVAFLTSHTKLVAVDEAERILGSVTTLSGQVYEAIIKETFIGKSVRAEDGFDDSDYLDRTVMEAAYDWVDRSGFLRTMLMPRFLDVLLKTEWYQRKLFVESALAAEDMRAFGQLERLGFPPPRELVMVGLPKRCAIYEYLLTEKLKLQARIIKITEPEAIDSLSIRGALELARRAGLL